MQVVNRYGESKQEKGWLKAVFLVIAWLLILSLVRDIWQIRAGFKRVTDSTQRLKVEEERNAELKRKYTLVQTEEYKERLIREKLNMQKEGEILVVLPGTAFGSHLTQENQPIVDEEKNWQKWLRILY